MNNRVLNFFIGLLGVVLAGGSGFGCYLAGSRLFKKVPDGTVRDNTLMIPLFFLALTGVMIGITIAIIFYAKTFKNENGKRLYRKK